MDREWLCCLQGENKKLLTNLMDKILMVQPSTVNWCVRKRSWLGRESLRRLKQLRERTRLLSRKNSSHNFGPIWRMKGRPEFMKLLASVDVHAPAKLRCQCANTKLRWFLATYDVKEGRRYVAFTRRARDYLCGKNLVIRKRHPIRVKTLIGCLI